MIEATALGSLKGVRHGFFTRQGGVSGGLYASLNCGVGSRDERACVAENRARVARRLGAAPDRLVTLYQVHSAHAIATALPWSAEGAPKADAVVTATPGLVIGALAADCAPVLFCDPHARVIGAAHAGWRGALAGVVEATVAQMEGLGARRDRIVAALGPCLSQAAYEVGEEFEQAFLSADGANAAYFVRLAGGRAHFDLAGYVADRLRAAGLAHVETMARCTYGEEDLFFSYRRAVHRREPDYGRQVSAIVLE